MRGKEAEPLLLEEGRQVLEEEEPEERRRVVGGDEVGDSKPTAGGASSGSGSAANDNSGVAATTSGGQLEGEAEEAAHPVTTAPGPERAEEDVEVATPLEVSSSLHFECARQLPVWLVLVETALDVLQFVQTELELGIWSVLVLRHGLLALLNLLMAVKDCFDEVKEEVQYQYETKCRKVERKELSTGLQAKILVPVLVRLRLFPKEAAPSGTWWNQKLQHAARVIAVVQVEVRLNLVILLVGCASPLYSVAKAALSGSFDRLAQVTAVNALQIIVFNLYKAHEKRQQMWQLEQKVQELRKDRTLNWEAREKLQELRDDRLSLSDKVRCFHELVVEYPEYFFNDSHWRESEAHYVDIYSVPSDPARTGARGGVPALEDVSKLLGMKLDGCKDKEETAGEEEASAILLVQGEAGAGKSTLAKLVALRATKASLEIEQRHAESHVTGVAASVAPLVVYLHCAQHQRDGGSRVSVRSYLEAHLVGDSSQISDKDWSSFLEETAIVLVLDAYDEADSHFTLREVLQQDGLVSARSLHIVATLRSGTFETDEKAKETFSFEIKGQKVSPLMRWLRPIGDEERKSSALAPFAAVDDLWQKLHLKHPGLARVATTPLMAALLAEAHKSGSLSDIGRDDCGAAEATLGSRICKSRVRRRAHLISWRLKRQVEMGIASLLPFADIDLVLHKLLLGATSTSTSASPSDPSMLKDVWMKAGKVVARKLASLMWLRDTTVLRVTPPKVPGKEGCCFASLRSILPLTLSPCCSGASADGSYFRLDSEVAGATDRAEEKGVNDDVGQQLRDCLRNALLVELQAGSQEASQPLTAEVAVDMHVMLLYMLGFCCSLKILRTADAGTCEVAFTHDTFRACRLAEAMASQNDWSWSVDGTTSSLWARRLLLAHEHKDLITLLADITRSSVPFQNDFLWRCIEESKLQTRLGDQANHSNSRQQCSAANGSWHGNEEEPKSVAAANAATVLACAQVSFSGRDLSRAQLPGACLRGAVCHGTSFDGANLQGADLSHIFAEAASFRGARLQKAWYGEYAMLNGHSEQVECVAFSPDGRNIASGSCDKTVRVWDAASGAPVMTLEGHSNDVCCIAYSPDGSTIASGSTDTTIRLWDATTGSHIRTLAGHSGFTQCLAYSPDGTTVASGSLDTIRLWDASSGVVTQTLELAQLPVYAKITEANWLPPGYGHVPSLAYHPVGKALASACCDTILLWDVASGSHMMTLEGHSDEVLSVAYSPDGRSIASGSRDRTVRVWDAVAGSNLLTIEGHSGDVSCVAYSPDGATIACCGGEGTNTIRLVDATSGSRILTLAGHLRTVMVVAYSPDGRFLASADDHGVIRLWDAVSGPCMLQRDGHSDPVDSVAFSPDGSTITSGSQSEDEDLQLGTLRLWDAESGCHILTLEGDAYRFSFSPDGKRVASPAAKAEGCGQGIRLWDAVSGEGQKLTLEGLRGEVKDVAFSPDGRTLATRSFDDRHQFITLWDTVTWTDKVTLLAGAFVSNVAFSPDCGIIAAGTDKGAELWNVKSGSRKATLTGASRVAGCVVAFSPDNSSACKLATAGGEICVWNVEEGSQLLCLRGHSALVSCVAFSPNGSAIVSCSCDKTIRLWDAASGAHRLTLEGHTYFVRCVAFSPDGRSIASASWDQTIKVWQCMSSSSEHGSREAEEAGGTAPSSNSEGSDRWLLQRSIECAEPALQAAGADFRGAQGLSDNAKLMLEQKGAKVD